MAKLYKPQNEKGHDLVAVSEINNSDLKIDNSFLNITNSGKPYEDGDEQKLVTGGTLSKTIKNLEDNLASIIADNEEIKDLISDVVDKDLDEKIEEATKEIQDNVKVLHQTVWVEDTIEKGKVEIKDHVQEQKKFFIAAYVEQTKGESDFIPFFPNVEYTKDNTIKLTFIDEADSEAYEGFAVKLVISQTVVVDYNAQPLPPVQSDSPIMPTPSQEDNSTNKGEESSDEQGPKE